MTDADLKPGWRKWRFDQIATNVNDRIDNPSESDFEYYVGLEHIDPDSLKLRRWGSPSDVEATKLIFRKGDIIFGRRRVYQRKVAVAEFDGICSAHALVLRANPEVALPEFLPFFTQSDLFMERAKSISVGSLSPTINWKTLAKEEFYIPSLKEQIRFSEALQELEETNNLYQEAVKDGENLISAIVEDFLRSDFQKVSLGKVLTDTSYGCSKKANPDETGVPILRIPNVLRDELDLSDLQWISLSETELKRYSVKSGDILLVRTNGNPAYVGRCVVVRDLPQAMAYASYLIRLQVKKETATPDFVATLLNSISVRRMLRGDVRSSAGNFNVNTKGIKKQEIPLPSLEQQKSLVEKTKNVNASINKLNERIFQAISIKKKILQTLGSAV